MNLLGLFRNIRPFVKPYRLLVAITLILTLVGSLMQQVNAIVLDRTVDAINALIGTDFSWNEAARILTIISVVLLGKEVFVGPHYLCPKLLWGAHAHLCVAGPFAGGD